MTHMKLRVISGIFIVLGHVGQFGLLKLIMSYHSSGRPQGGSMYGICVLTSMKSNFTLTGSQGSILSVGGLIRSH